MRTRTASLLSLPLFLWSVPCGYVRGADDVPVVTAHPKPGTSAEEAAKVRGTARLMTVYFGFNLVCDHLKPRPAWLDQDARIEFDVLPATPALLRRAELAPVRPAAGERGEFYFANVYAKGDPKQKPLYLYLLVMHGNRTELVRAFQLKNGRMEKTAG